MNKFGGTDDSARAKKLSKPKIALYFIILTVLAFIIAILQTSNINIFGQTADALLALVCSVGFIFGASFGAMFGLLAGIIIVLLGAYGFTLTPILYVLCGYLCGALLEKFLSSNFVSFLIFGALAGILREFFTMIYFGLNSSSFNFGQLITDVIIGEYFAYALCLIPLYFTVLGIYLLFKGKDEASHIIK
ncbi:MAG: hypothetical protein E7677_01390 [Ruminococcaceae bacterium]|nr:hypothetical protein [Oscillospiraceae bacterium]